MSKHCYDCKHCTKTMYEKPCDACRGFKTDYLYFEEMEFKEMNNRCIRFNVAGMPDAFDYIMFNKKKLIHEVTLLWKDDTQFNITIRMNKDTMHDICVHRNPHNVQFDYLNMKLMDIPVEFDSIMSNDIIIIEAEKKAGYINRFYNMNDINSDLRKMALNSVFGMTTQWRFKIKDVIYNKPATIIRWTDGTKTVVKCADDEPYDKEKGFAMAFMKKVLGNEGRYYETVKKFVPMDEKPQEIYADMMEEAYQEGYRKGVQDSGKHKGRYTISERKPLYYLSCKQYGARINKAEGTIRHWCLEGKIEGVLKGPQGYQIPWYDDEPKGNFDMPKPIVCNCTKEE